jgi:hypothetical protein
MRVDDLVRKASSWPGVVRAENVGAGMLST